MNIFIDTCSYLAFYDYSDEYLDLLKKLWVVIRDANYKVYLTEQVYNEFKKNRDNKIASVLKRFKTQNPDNSFPQICKDYEEYKNLQIAVSQYNENKKKLLEKLEKDIASHKLRADKIINIIFRYAKYIETSDGVYQLAIARVNKCYPPGKIGKETFGDAINWESLLKEFPNSEDIVIISQDGDYFSNIQETQLLDYLKDEWVKKKNSNIAIYRGLSAYFAENFPEAKNSQELEKKLAIEHLKLSMSFAMTHIVIDKLSKYTDYSKKEVQVLVDSILINNQVSSIATDPDVKSFIEFLLSNYQSKIPDESFYKLTELIREEEDDNNLNVFDSVNPTDIPF